MSYHKFVDEEGNEYGSFEVFHSSDYCLTREIGYMEGWYWWPCFPGHFPDSSANGPFGSEEEAIVDAKERDS